MEFKHIPIMRDLCIDFLAVKPSGTYVDCTAGGGGHSQEILKKLSDGKLIAIDKDIEAINACKKRLNNFSSKKICYVHNDYKHFCEILDELGINTVDGILIDLGISSYQIDNAERGFSYFGGQAELDMRMNRDQALTAKDIVNTYSEQRLYEIFRDLGEERFAKSIVRNIANARSQHEIVTCGELADIVDRSIPYAAKRNGGHPAKRVFQALRIEINGELSNLELSIRSMVERLSSGGRMVVLTFHSLEDRIIKQVFADLAKNCICPPRSPICICKHRATVKILHNKPITAGENELLENPRSASCKLRAIEKI